LSHANLRLVTRFAGGAAFAATLALAAPAFAAPRPAAKARTAKAGGGGSAQSGGAKIAPAPSKSKPAKPKAKSSTTAKTAPTTKTAKATTPVVITPNGGSQHLGQRVLKPGMKGHDVRVLQGYLSIAGFSTNVDGSYGPATKRSVMAFEVSKGLTPDGIVSYALAAELRAAVAAADTAVGPVGGKARINPDGTATAPAGAPAVVQAVIAAANKIHTKPYLYAGGHGKWNDVGYDCSGAVSYALHGAGLLSSPEDSTGLESYGAPGPGQWITIYADAQHTFIVVAGIAFDTADYGGPNIPGGTGPRWRSNPTGNLADGGDYVVRHSPGL
jgi:peptidoglycan hydrolase-like protein with peptidoglycan-binding domain